MEEGKYAQHELDLDLQFGLDACHRKQAFQTYDLSEEDPDEVPFFSNYVSEVK